jgi:hypothetical protein
MMTAPLGGKRLELLKRTVPDLTRTLGLTIPPSVLAQATQVIQ